MSCNFNIISANYADNADEETADTILDIMWENGLIGKYHLATVGKTLYWVISRSDDTKNADIELDDAMIELVSEHIDKSPAEVKKILGL